MCYLQQCLYIHLLLFVCHLYLHDFPVIDNVDIILRTEDSCETLVKGVHRIVKRLSKSIVILTSVCLSSSFKWLGYLSSRVKGFDRLVVRILIPDGDDAPWFSINSDNSVLLIQMQQFKRKEKEKYPEFYFSTKFHVLTSFSARLLLLLDGWHSILSKRF